MAEVFDLIRSAVASGRYIVGVHAGERLRERGVTAWQVAGGLVEGKLLLERPRDKPNPAVEVEQLLPDGTPVKAVWSWLKPDREAKLVTVHFFDDR